MTAASVAIDRARARLVASAEHQAHAHELDPKDVRIKGLIANVLMGALGEIEAREDELTQLRRLRESLQVAVGSSCASVEATVLRELADLEVFYKRRDAAESEG